MKDWIDVNLEKPPFMKDLVFAMSSGQVLSGWNESCEPEEDPSYCFHQHWLDVEGEVTHFAPYPKHPRDPHDCPNPHN